MNVITTLKDKRRDKQIKYERKMLREISLNVLRKNIHHHFQEYCEKNYSRNQFEDYCIELAIESYLLGARYSKFGCYGESLTTIKHRSLSEEQNLTETLYLFLTNVHLLQETEQRKQSLYYICQSFIDSWWKEGFEKGERRYKLRLR
ncbi:DUF2521 family protein [Bacillus sp. 165]|uniref:DUF2521 family protein n=1 Tax=Bacillus sp. 165 TaxID=1529117 RepID=UPI001ADC92FE|nr:DUF2521 family protein [Bacillus sp. 165]MBO9131128.1 DUF2521 family protein [Bacillus sp. 165]